MKILIISPDYPDSRRSVYTFVEQLVNQFDSLGHKCCVIAPFSITKNKTFSPAKERHDNVYILRPKYVSVSNFDFLGVKWSVYFRSIAIKKALKHLPFTPDIIYAHFWRSGREIYQYAERNNIPLFVASGESSISNDDVNPLYHEFYNYVRGVICVSSKNRDESVAKGLTNKEKCVVLPNGINPELFHPLGRQACRQKLGLPEDAFIVAFCGQLSHRKGVKVLSDALDRITTGKPVHVLFIGRPMGELPTCHNILHCGPVAHDVIVTYLNAADIFVLPTLHEGCSNAIVEAMACGLPIVSSDRPFNYDILSADNALLIDPTDSYQIANAIMRLRDDKEMRIRLSKGALAMTQKLSLAERAKNIVLFMEERCNSK